MSSASKSPDVCTCSQCVWLRGFRAVVQKDIEHLTALSNAILTLLVDKGIVTAEECDARTAELHARIKEHMANLLLQTGRAKPETGQ